MPGTRSIFARSATSSSPRSRPRAATRASLDIAGQVGTGGTAASRARALADARGLIDAGATHVILGMPAALGPAGLDDVVAEILVPLREATA